ncbi:MAG: PQQ-dependent sugar dehydrogenase, partial [Chloroflexota bacterium]
MRTFTVMVLLLIVLATGQPASAANFEDNRFSDTILTNNISRGTSMVFAPDGRLFILEQGGDLLIYENGALLNSSALSLDVDSRGERGLLGLAFDPNFTVNNHVYIYYTPDATP